MMRGEFQTTNPEYDFSKEMKQAYSEKGYLEQNILKNIIHYFDIYNSDIHPGVIKKNYIPLVMIKDSTFTIHECVYREEGNKMHIINKIYPEPTERDRLQKKLDDSKIDDFLKSSLLYLQNSTNELEYILDKNHWVIYKKESTTSGTFKVETEWVVN